MTETAMKRNDRPAAFDARLYVDAGTAKMLSLEIGKVRAWLTGFQAAGKAAPPGEDSLRQAQLLLHKLEWPRLRGP